MDSRTKVPSTEGSRENRGRILHRRVNGRLLNALHATLAIHFLLVIIMLIVAWKYQDYLEWDDGSEWMGMPEKPSKSSSGFFLGHTSRSSSDHFSEKSSDHFPRQSSDHFSQRSSDHFSRQSSNDTTTHKAQFYAIPGPYKRPEEDMDDYNDWITEPEDWIMDPPDSYKFMILNIHLLLLIPPLTSGICFKISPLTSGICFKISPLTSGICFIKRSFLCLVWSFVLQVISLILSAITMIMDLYHVSTGLIITRIFFYTNWIVIILLSIISLYQIWPRKENMVTFQEIRTGQGSPVGQEVAVSPPTEHSN